MRQQRLARRLDGRVSRHNSQTPFHFTIPTDTRNAWYVLRWKRAVQSLDTMAAGPADQESEAQPAPPAGESATSSAADGNKKEKVSIDMDEL